MFRPGSCYSVEPNTDSGNICHSEVSLFVACCEFLHRISYCEFMCTLEWWPSVSDWLQPGQMASIATICAEKDVGCRQLDIKWIISLCLESTIIRCYRSICIRPLNFSRSPFCLAKDPNKFLIIHLSQQQLFQLLGESLKEQNSPKMWFWLHLWWI